MNAAVAMRVCVAFAAFLRSHRSEAAARWDYLDQGVSWTGPGGQPALGNCAGPLQSPLDFGDQTTSFSVGLSEVTQSDPIARFWYRYPMLKEPARLVNDGHTVGITFPETYKAGFSPSSAASVEAMLSEQNFFRLHKLTVHSPSEHTLNGVQFPLEIQLIHQHGLTLRTGIVSIWFTTQNGAHSPLLDVLSEQGFPQQPFGSREVNLNANGPDTPEVTHGAEPVSQQRFGLKGFDLAAAVDAEGVGYLHYNGTLSEPPCEEKVQWYVRAAPIGAGAEQIQKFQQFITGINGPLGNARPTQQTEERKVVRMDSVDPTQPLAVMAPDPAAEPGPSQAPAAAPCADIPVFQSLVSPLADGRQVPDDVYDAKERFTKAEQDAVMARNWYTGANQLYIEAKTLYDRAPGLVEKIELQWNLIAMKDGLVAAQASQEANTEAAATVCAEVLELVCCFHSESAECGNALGPAVTCPNATNVTRVVTAASAANATNGTNATNATNATTASAPAPCPDCREPLPGEVVLPNGPAANPFSNSVAERVPRIGRGMMPAGYKDLSNSLRTKLEPGASSLMAKDTVRWLKLRKSRGPSVWVLE